MAKARKTNYELPEQLTGVARGGYAGARAVRDRAINEMRSRLEAALGRVAILENEKMELRRRIARLEQGIADRDEAILHALRAKHAAGRKLARLMADEVVS